MFLTPEEHCCLKLLKLCASPNRVIYRGNIRGRDATGHTYDYLIKKLEEKGFVKINKNSVKILDRKD